jgi:uncharacterized membrane protein HdeD (DUF308 family)
MTVFDPANPPEPRFAKVPASRWWAIALRGALAILIGLVCLFAPIAGFLALVFVFGIYAIVDGAIALGQSRRNAAGPRWVRIARGVLGIGAGILAMAVPGVAGLALVLVIGTWAMVSGALEIYTAIRDRDEIEGEWLLVLQGALAMVFGLLLFISPIAGAITLGIWIGGFAVIHGAVLLVAGFKLRAKHRGGPAGALPAGARAA